MFSYRTNRTKKINRLRADLAGISADKSKTRAAEAELERMTRMIPTGSDTPAFIEALYKTAKESGLKQHEVSTEADKTGGSARPGGSDSTSTIAKQRIKVSASGNFRSFAEYLRRIQNMERFNRIVEFKLLPDADQLKGTFAIELYYLPVKNAN